MTRPQPLPSFGALRQFARKRPPEERCELCSAAVSEGHSHLVEPLSHKLLCVCEPCALLFSAADIRKYKRVPRSVQFLAGFELSDAQWDGLAIPINMAFFLESSVSGKVSAFYPSPAGAVESELAPDRWNEIRERNPALRNMAADVEALLANRLGAMHGFLDAEYYRLPIDECYKLVWIIRSHWQGFSGGVTVWEKIQAYFTDLRARGGRHA